MLFRSNVVKEVLNGVVVTVPGPKPAEHQTELGFSIGGPIKIPFLFNGHDKLFFYSAYDKFRSRIAVNPTASTIFSPTLSRLFSWLIILFRRSRSWLPEPMLMA